MTPEGYTRVYVGGLNESIKKEDLQMEFEKFGKLNKVWVAFNPPGFAFIEFLSVDEAELACNNMNGTEIMGAKLRVEISRGRGRGGSRGGGGFRGSRGSGGRGGYGGGRGGNYRGGSNYGDSGGGGGGGGGGGYHSSSRGGGGGGRGRGRYGDDSYSSGRSSGYVSRDSYSQDSYGSGGGGGGGGDTGSSYYSGKDSGSRYRSRSPAGRGRYNLLINDQQNHLFHIILNIIINSSTLFKYLSQLTINNYQHNNNYSSSTTTTTTTTISTITTATSCSIITSTINDKLHNNIIIMINIIIKFINDQSTTHLPLRHNNNIIITSIQIILRFNYHHLEPT